MKMIYIPVEISKKEELLQKKIIKNQKIRARKIRRALNTMYEKGEHRTNVIDALTDLRHFCDIHHISVYDALDSSYQHYLAERKGEDL